MKIADCINGRDNNFNFIRLAAALAVLISHSFALATGRDAADPLLSLGLGISSGQLAVWVFFFISGFLVFASLTRSHDILDFGTARALRVFPGLVVMLVITVFVAGPLITQVSLAEYFSSPEPFQYFAVHAPVLPNLFLGHNWLPGVFVHNPYPNAVNGSLWTLPYELAMYIALAALWAVSRPVLSWRSKLRATAVVGAAALLLGVALFFKSTSHKLSAVIAGMGYMFSCGCAFFMFRDRIELSGRAALVATALIIASAGAGQHFFFVACLLLTPYVMIVLAFVPRGIVRSVNSVGDYSYGIYIYAFPIQQALVAFIPQISVLELILSSGTLTLLCAVGSWHFIERRALALKRKVGTRAPSRPASAEAFQDSSTAPL